MNDSDLNRFMDKVCPEPNTGCWLWSAYTDRRGYGRIFTNRGSYRCRTCANDGVRAWRRRNGAVSQ